MVEGNLPTRIYLICVGQSAGVGLFKYGWPSRAHAYRFITFLGGEPYGNVLLPSQLQFKQNELRGIVANKIIEVKCKRI